MSRWLSLGKAEAAEVNHRPSGLQFEHAERSGVKVVQFAWPIPPATSLATRSLPYEGEPVDSL